MRRQHAAVLVEPCSPPRFEATDPAMLKYLEEHGYAIVRSAIKPGSDEMERIKCQFWDWHESIGHGVRREEPSTWGREFVAHPATGIIAAYGFGQSRFLWSLRTLPAVRSAFEAIWKTADLLSSFDGGNAFRPDPAWRTQGGWWHCDQNGTKPDRQGRVCVQGLVLLTPANEWTGGFCVVPRTHMLHAAFSERHPWADQQGDFLPVPEGDAILNGGGCLLRAEPGDLILWDSRTIHCNTPALAPLEDAPEGAVPPPQHLLRMAGYVCFTPASWCPSEVIEQRARAALDLITSTHWPHDYVPTGQAPEWMGARAIDDYTPDETRLILGDSGRWPEAATLPPPPPTAAPQSERAKPAASLASKANGREPAAGKESSKTGSKRASKSSREGAEAARQISRGNRRPLSNMPALPPRGRSMDHSNRVSASSAGLLNRLYDVLSPGRGSQPSTVRRS